MAFKVLMAALSGIVIFGGMWAVLAVPCWILWWRRGEAVPNVFAFGAYGLAAIIWISFVIAVDPVMFAL